MIRALLLSLALLAGCSSPVPPEPTQTPATASAATQAAVVADEPLPEAVAAAAPVQNAVVAAIEALEPITIEATPEPPPESNRVAECRRAAAALIIRWEITGEGYYKKRLLYPIWPHGPSGITWAVGYDGGHQTSRTILDDWTAHPHKARLALTAGLTGQRAKAALPKYRDIETPFPYAAEVFETRSLIEYERIAERAYRIKMEDVPVGVCAALTSLTYNRGGATAGDSRKEIRNIRDAHLPAKNWLAVAEEIRAMKRLWRGTVNENGLSARRESEAKLIETLI